MRFLLFFYFVFQGNFQVQASRGAYIWRGDLREGFCVTSLGSLYMEGLIFGILRYYAILQGQKIPCFKCSGSEERETWWRAFRRQNRNETHRSNYPESFSLNYPRPNPTLRSLLFFAPSTNTLTPWQTKVAFHLSEMNGRPIPSLPRSLFFGCHAKNGCEGD